MGVITLPNYGSDPATVNASNLDGKVNPLATEFNGGIDNDNIDAAAAIAASKLNLATIAQVMAMSSKIFKLAKGADVASAAGEITLGEDGNYFDITGTAAITSIVIKQAGTIVVLQTDSTASLVDGSNLKLNGNFVGAAESQIMLVSDGTNWFEVSRQPGSTALTTQGDILYRSATADTRLAAGTLGQLLFTSGAAANPVWSGTEETAVTDTTQRDETSATYVDVTSETITYTSLGGFAWCQYTALLSNSGAPQGNVALTNGSGTVLDEFRVNLNSGGSVNDRITVNLSWIGKVAAGSFTFKIQQKTDSGRTQNLQNDEVSAKLRVIHFG